MAGEVSIEHIYQEEVYRVSLPVTVLVPCPWSEVKDGVRQSLTNILKALGQSLESVRIIHQPQFDLSTYAEKPKRLIAFVQPPKGLDLYEVHVTDKTSIVFAGGLDVLSQDEATKRMLWDALKALFGS